MDNLTLNSSCFTDIESQFVIIAWLNQAMGFLSLLACLFGLSVILLFKKWRFFTQRLVLYLILSATLVSIINVTHRADYGSPLPQSYDGFCVFIAFGSQVTAWMILNAITAITIYLFLRVGWDKSTEKYEILYVLFIFASPLTLSWIPFIRQAYGRAGVWCWIRSIDLITCEPFQFGVALQLALFYVPAFVLLPVLVLLYLLVLCRLHQRGRRVRQTRADQAPQHTQRIIRREVASLLAYPIIFTVGFTPGICNRIYGWVMPGRPLLVLWYITAISYPLLGLVIVLAFTLDSDTRRRLNRAHVRAAFRDCCAKKTVSDYPVEEVQESGQHRKVPYSQLKDDSTG